MGAGAVVVVAEAMVEEPILARTTPKDSRRTYVGEEEKNQKNLESEKVKTKNV